MLKRDVVPLPQYLFPAHEWRLVETAHSDRYLARAESIFALSNGYLGVRGTFEEGRPAGTPGTFVNGLHETWPIEYAEPAYGLARTGQTMVSAPDATQLCLYVDDEPLFLPTARMPEYRRSLDMRDGVLTRELLWATDFGKQVRISSARLVSLEERHLVAMQYIVTSLANDASVAIASRLVNRHKAQQMQDRDVRDPRAAKLILRSPLVQALARHDRERLLVGYHTINSGMTLGVGVDHVIETASPMHTEICSSDDGSELLITVDAKAGVPIVITKYAAYHSSREVPPEELVGRCERTLTRAVASGFDRLVAKQRQQLDRFWDRADVRVETDLEGTRTQQAIRWNLYQVAQATWCSQGSGVPARGLTGLAYDGHYFWDSEIWVMPFLSHTQPRMARNLLRFRHGMLPRARIRARELSQRGALYSWRTINGDEASANYQAGTAQYHINADVAFALVHYVDVRDDKDFLAQVGVEMLVETARLWEDLGFYGRDGMFHIHGVTGPDEYTTVVNDNTYTNLMARENLRTAAQSVRWLQSERPDEYLALAESLNLEPAEIDAWEAAASSMHIPYDEERGIHPQDDAFLDREVWDVANTPPEQFPLLLHHHPLVIYRFQVIKQADIVLAMFLLGSDFTEDQKRRNFDYYDDLTTGDSSLSACIQSIIATEVGRHEQAYEYFRHGLWMDLADAAGNAADGVHIASAAGVWLSLVYGFGGLRDSGGGLSFSPHLPEQWTSLEFSVRFQDRQVRVQLTPDEERFLIVEGEPLEVRIHGVSTVLKPGEKVVVHPAPHRLAFEEGRRDGLEVGATV
jgi:alpha,alpha-trehalose phosphorylase